jgi:hypothetical protein
VPWTCPTPGALHPPQGWEGCSSSFEAEGRPSPFPRLDDFIRAQACVGGVEGVLRSWQYAYGPTSGPDQAPQVSLWSILSYIIGRNRWCGRIGASAARPPVRACVHALLIHVLTTRRAAPQEQPHHDGG